MPKMQMFDQEYRDKLFRACREDYPPDDPLCVLKCRNLIYALDVLQKAMEPTAEDYSELGVLKPKERGEDQ